MDEMFQHVKAMIFGLLTLLGSPNRILSSVDGAQIDVTPSSFQVAVSQLVHVNCLPDGTSARAQEILVMEISKDGQKPIVNIRPPAQISIGGGLSNRFKAEGIINNSDIAKSFLNLTIGFPQIGDAGDYTCASSYIAETGLLRQDKASAQLLAYKSNSSSIDDNVRILETKVSNLLERVAAVEKENLKLQTDNKNFSHQLDYILDREHYTVAFSAAVQEETTIVSSRNIVFSDVIINEGQGYNETTGEFIAPKAGLYVFHLVLEIGPRGSVGEISLNVDGQDVAKLYTQDKDYKDQSSVSSVSRLRVGSVVKAVVRSAAGSNGSNPRVFNERLCIFSGCLIKLSW